MGDAGCLAIIGLIIVSIALGSLFGGAVGWLLFGSMLLVIGLLAAGSSS